jgi:NAD(P)-dependent dehydrogenase (short-subunit alcohol dehydrogenase family)
MMERGRKGAAPPPAAGEIRVGVRLDYDLSAKWFPGMSLQHEQESVSVLRGPLPDQAALFGILRRLQDLAVPLLTVTVRPKGEIRRPHLSLGDSSMNTRAASDPYPEGESILVTGCSSGIGLASALHLASTGFHVLATVRRESDAQRLRNFRLKSLEPICPLDLSDSMQIAAAADSVREALARKGNDRLYAVVNNAGGGFIAPVELLDLDRFRLELETRVLGPVALLQNLLPLIRRARGGRILWIATPALVAIPYVASIHACEFAMHCIAQSLHLELSPWNIPNVLIGCGGIRTAAPARTALELEAAMREWPRDRAEGYLPSLRKLQDQFDRFDRSRTDPEQVARVVHAALAAEKPKRTYRVGHQANLLHWTSALPRGALERFFRSRI